MTAGLKHKLRSQKGETLIELLVSILIAALSVGMLMTGVTVSSRLNQAAQERDAVFYQLLTNAESRHDPITTVSVSPGVRIQEGGRSFTVPVRLYGDEKLCSYGTAAAEGSEP